MESSRAASLLLRPGARIRNRGVSGVGMTKLMSEASLRAVGSDPTAPDAFRRETGFPRCPRPTVLMEFPFFFKPGISVVLDRGRPGRAVLGRAGRVTARGPYFLWPSPL